MTIKEWERNCKPFTKHGICTRIYCTVYTYTHYRYICPTISIHLFKNLPIHLSIHPSSHPHIYVYLSTDSSLSIIIFIFLSCPLSVHPSTCAAIYLPMHLIHLSIHPTIFSSIHPSTHLSIHQSVHSPIHPSIYYLSASLSLSVPLSVFLSTSVFICPCLSYNKYNCQMCGWSAVRGAQWSEILY